MTADDRPYIVAFVLFAVFAFSLCGLFILINQL